ncbi:MAG: hypothetical protein NXI32_06090 [bacterium]|nr:hypothetical protein [bacterium]
MMNLTAAHLQVASLCITCLCCGMPPCAHAQEPNSLASPEAARGTPRSELESKQQLIQQAVLARDSNAAQLNSAFGVGKIQYTVHEADQPEPVVVLDADIQMFFDQPKYRVHLVYEQKLNESVRVQGQNEEDFERWSPSSLAEQVVMYDGEQIVSIECDHDRNCTGTIYFGFAKMAVMRNAGFPFEDPVSLWSQALHLEGLDLKNTSLTPLEQGGFVGLLSKNTYRMKFFVLDQFGYDLRRVSSYRIGETQPFRDYLLDWGESNGLHYVRRFTNVVTSANRDTGSNVQTVRKLSIEYSHFEANIPVSEEVFSLTAMGVPEGTPFLDKRSTVDGGPKELLFSNGSLQEANTPPAQR